MEGTVTNCRVGGKRELPVRSARSEVRRRNSDEEYCFFWSPYRPATGLPESATTSPSHPGLCLLLLQKSFPRHPASACTNRLQLGLGTSSKNTELCRQAGIPR